MLLCAIVVCFCLAIIPLYNFLAERQAAHRMLADTLQQIRAQLPPPDAPDAYLQSEMPLAPYTPAAQRDHSNPESRVRLKSLEPDAILRNGFRYYPKRKAYKYRFQSRNFTNPHGERKLIRPYIPEPLERRSIWFQAIDGRWRCYAGVKNSVRKNLQCDDAEVVRNLSVKDHRHALRISDCTRLAFTLQEWDLPANTHLVYLRNYKDSDDEVDVAIDEPGRDVVILVKNERDIGIFKRIYFYYTDDTRIRGFIWLGGRQNIILGLPENTRVFDYQEALRKCEGKGDFDAYINYAEWTFSTLSNSSDTPHIWASRYDTMKKVPAEEWQAAHTVLQFGKVVGVISPRKRKIKDSRNE